MRDKFRRQKNKYWLSNFFVSDTQNTKGIVSQVTITSVWDTLFEYESETPRRVLDIELS